LRSAGITKPTLYHFFGSKDGVLQALVQTGFQQYRALVNAAMDTPGSFQDRVKVLARAVFDSASTQAALLAFHSQRHLGASGYGVAANRELHAVLRRRRRRAGSGR
jgi:AcrR family transcriptional regulator